jgi:ribosomal protein L11 methyltransferase
MDIYISYTIDSVDEIVLGLLSQFDFESFEEYDDHMIAYIKKDLLTVDVIQDIHRILTERQVDYKTEEMEPQNWNEIWESNFQPVYVDQFCQIRADFHPPLDGYQYDLVINPKMAFGTGHHATTYMMVKQMESIEFQHKSVFDFGCGTGILAILAAMQGATDIDAVDIEEESYHNTIENASINEITQIKTFCGDLDAVPQRNYDVVLANINRNILLRYVLDLYARTAAAGTILLSGILVEDIEKVIAAFTSAGYDSPSILTEDRWACIKMVR